MKICWDNLEKLRYNTITQKWYRGNKSYIYIEKCKMCGESYLTRYDVMGCFCSMKCSGKNNKKELKNKRFGRLVVLKDVLKRDRDMIVWKCKCDCGNITEVRGSGLLSGNTKSCGCLQKDIIIENYSGPNSPSWKGGLSYEPYCEQWKDKEYKESIKERDGYKCLNPECNKKCKILNIHHIDYNKKNCNPLNLITLCISCNSKANKDREWHKLWYYAIIKNRYSKEKK